MFMSCGLVYVLCMYHFVFPCIVSKIHVISSGGSHLDQPSLWVTVRAILEVVASL